MNRRETIIALLVLAGSVPTARALRPAKIPRIGVLGVDLESAPRSVE